MPENTDHFSVEIRSEDLLEASADLSLAAHSAAAVILAANDDDAKADLVMFSECINAVFEKFGWMITAETWAVIRNSGREEFRDVVKAYDHDDEVPS